jgi:hypothetical protein
MWANNVKPTMKRCILEVKKCLPTMIICDPQEKFPLETKHQFEATKLYLMTDNDGSEFGIVICPAHQLPISVVVRRSVAH